MHNFIVGQVCPTDKPINLCWAESPSYIPVTVWQILCFFTLVIAKVAKKNFSGFLYFRTQ